MPHAPGAGRRASPSVAVALVERPDHLLGLRRVTLADRASARLCVAALDRKLAAGAKPESEIALELRARRLIAPRTRRQLARSLRRMVALPMRPSARGLPVHCPHISEGSAELLALAARLEDAGAVEARGVALTRLLLTDGAGPLHHHQAPGRLSAAAREAAAALVPATGDQSPEGWRTT